MSNSPSYPVGSVDNALRLIALLRARGQVRVSEVADHLGIARSTAHRLLAALAYRGFAVQDERRAYRAGPAIGEIGAAPRVADLPALVRPRLQRLSRDLGETVHLMVLDGPDVVFVDGVEGSGTLRVTSRVGMRLPARSTSGGKVLLSELPLEDLRDLVGVDARLERQLAVVRRQGYATNFGESEPGIHAVGVGLRLPGTGAASSGSAPVQAGAVPPGHSASASSGSAPVQAGATPPGHSASASSGSAPVQAGATAPQAPPTHHRGTPAPQAPPTHHLGTPAPHAPPTHHLGTVVAAIAVSVPSVRCPRARIPDLVRALHTAAVLHDVRQKMT